MRWQARFVAPSTSPSHFSMQSGLRLRFQHGELIYPDHQVREHDIRRLDTHIVAPPHVQVLWKATPTLIVNGNLAAILLTTNHLLRSRVIHALAD